MKWWRKEYCTFITKIKIHKDSQKIRISSFTIILKKACVDEFTKSLALTPKAKCPNNPPISQPSVRRPAWLHQWCDTLPAKHTIGTTWTSLRLGFEETWIGRKHCSCLEKWVSHWDIFFQRLSFSNKMPILNMFLVMCYWNQRMWYIASTKTIFSRFKNHDMGSWGWIHKFTDGSRK